MNDARQYAFYLSEQNVNQLDAIRGIKSRSQCVRELIEDAFQYWEYQRTEEYYGNLEETKLTYHGSPEDIKNGNK